MNFILFYRAVLEDDAFTRMKAVVKWYLSGFYKKPQGLKKPYNPLLGETFRCYWQHSNGSRTFYLAEQVTISKKYLILTILNNLPLYCQNITKSFLLLMTNFFINLYSIYKIYFFYINILCYDMLCPILTHVFKCFC